MSSPILSRPQNHSRLRFNRRQKTLLAIALCFLFLIMIVLSSWLIDDAGLNPVLTQRNQPPSLAHGFGSDWLGRDMLTRSLYGMSLSVRVGLLAASFSAVIGTGLGLISGTLGGKVDAVITWIIDVFFSGVADYDRVCNGRWYARRDRCRRVNTLDKSCQSHSGRNLAGE